MSGHARRAARPPGSRADRGALAQLSRLDPDLFSAIPPTERPLAERSTLVRTAVVRRGVWMPPAPADGNPLGLLVAGGVAIRRIEVGGRFAGEILGPGDVLRPWETNPRAQIVPAHVEWQVLLPLTVAVLDEGFTQRAARWPVLLSEIMSRAVGRVTGAMAQCAVAQLARTEERLLWVLWELAERFGKVTPDGVVLSLPLRHHHLATLIGCLRPSVTLAMQRLAALGLVERRPNGYVLHGQADDAWRLVRSAQPGVERRNGVESPGFTARHEAGRVMRVM